MKKIFILITFLPNILSAQIVITEVMYNPEGTDSGREWIEILNTGEDINIEDYKLYENDVSHSIKALIESENILKSNEYAVIVDNPDKFIADYGSEVSVFDSAFSLNNTGELISIVDSENNVINVVEYSKDWGANGDGNSLQYIEDRWVFANPSPGAASEGGFNEVFTPIPKESTHSDDEELTEYEEKIDLEVGMGRNRYITINTPIWFNMSSNINRTKAFWSFGDGGKGKGDKIKHTYYYPGIYNVVLKGEYGDNEVASRIKVMVREPELRIKWINSGKLVDIMLSNDSDFEVNLGDFFFIYENNSKKYSFKLPNDTIIDPNSTLYIPGKISDIEYLKLGLLKLYYPNGVEYK